jgi:hypothetical protein
VAGSFRFRARTDLVSSVTAWVRVLSLDRAPTSFLPGIALDRPSQPESAYQSQVFALEIGCWIGWLAPVSDGWIGWLAPVSDGWIGWLAPVSDGTRF